MARMEAWFFIGHWLLVIPSTYWSRFKIVVVLNKETLDILYSCK